MNFEYPDDPKVKGQIIKSMGGASWDEVIDTYINIMFWKWLETRPHAGSFIDILEEPQIINL